MNTQETKKDVSKLGSEKKLLRIQQVLRKGDNVPASVFYSSNVVPPSNVAGK